MGKEVKELCSTGRKYQRPSERTARFILGVLCWIRDIFTTSTTIIPRGQMVQHEGEYLSAGKEIRYPLILLVEDNPHIAQEFIDAIKKYYLFGTVRIHVAYAYDAAVTFFDNEEINLVIMDADLDDREGDGAALTRKFIGERPQTCILANSSSRISTLKLTGFGAIASLEKSTEKLKGWLVLNDPTGSTG